QHSWAKFLRTNGGYGERRTTQRRNLTHCFGVIQLDLRQVHKTNAHRTSTLYRLDSLLVTHYSLLITHYSLLVTHYSLLVTRYSLLVTRYSLLVTFEFFQPFVGGTMRADTLQ